MRLACKFVVAATVIVAATTCAITRADPPQWSPSRDEQVYQNVLRSHQEATGLLGEGELILLLTWFQGSTTNMCDRRI